MNEITAATFHTVAVHNSINIVINKDLIFYPKFRLIHSADFKTSFGGIIQLQCSNAIAVQFYIKKNFAY